MLFFLNVIYYLYYYLVRKLYYIYVYIMSQYKSHISKKWYMGQNALGQPDCCNILKSTIYLETNDKIPWVFVCWYKYIEFNSWLKHFWVYFVKNGCGHSGCGSQKLAVSQEWNDGMKLFFACWYKFKKAKS